MKQHLNHIQSTFFVFVLCFALLFSVPSSHAVEAGTNTDSTGTTQTEQPHQDEQKPVNNGTSDNHQNNATHDPPPDSDHEEEHHEEGEEHDDYCEDLYDEIGVRCGDDDGCWMEEQNNFPEEDRVRCFENKGGEHEDDDFDHEEEDEDEWEDEEWEDDEDDWNDDEWEDHEEGEDDHDYEEDEDEYEEEHDEYEEEEYDEHQIYAEFQHEFPCDQMIFKEAIDRCDAAGLSPEQCRQVVLPSVLENKMRDGRCGDGAHEDFDEYEDEESEHMEGCIPRFATLPEVKREMHGADKSDVLAEFKKRKHWLSQEVSQNGGDPQEFMDRWDEMDICDDDGPPGSHGPGGGQMGPPGPPPPGMDRRGPGGPHVGEVFGRAIGELVSRLQDPNLPDEVKQKMQKALAWFSAKVGEISNGADPKQFVDEARQILQDVMGHSGPGRGGGGMGPGGPGMPPPHAGDARYARKAPAGICADVRDGTRSRRMGRVSR
jgi:hypothetical protein